MLVEATDPTLHLIGDMLKGSGVAGALVLTVAYLGKRLFDSQNITLKRIEDRLDNHDAGAMRSREEHIMFRSSLDTTKERLENIEKKIEEMRSKFDADIFNLRERVHALANKMTDALLKIAGIRSSEKDE